MKSTFSMKHLIVAIAGALLLGAAAAQAYVEAPYTLGRLVSESSNILIMKVEKVDTEKNLIIYRKVKDIKGTHPTDIIKHNIAKAGFHPREWQFAMEGAKPGATAIFMHNGGASETFLNNYWYQAYAGEWWGMSHGEPFLLRSFSGKPEKLAAAVTAMLQGQEVVVTAQVDDKPNLHLKQAKVQRMKASLKLLDYNARRDFVGWGSEDFRAIQGMPAFAQYTAIARTDPEASGIATADFDGDGKIDIAMFGAGKVAVLKNAGASMDEVTLPYSGGARAASWGDWNGDGKPDLLLATPTGPVLLTNVDGASFRDDSALLPKESYYALTTAAFIDADGDKKPDILLANGFLGLRLYRNKGIATPPAPAPAAPAAGQKPAAPVPAAAPKELAFEDVSDKLGLGRNGIGSGVKGFQLVIADVDGDGRSDFLYTAGNGILAKNTPAGFVVAKDCGINFKPSRTAPVFYDFDGDAKPDLTLVDGNVIKLFKNDGKGVFADITMQRGDLAKPVENAGCLVWCDFYNQGRPDLMVGILKGTNRLLKNTGDGKFTDVSEEIGLTQKVFNTRAIAVVDLNNDKVPDVVFNNEGQDSSVLLGDPRRFTRKATGE